MRIAKLPRKVRITPEVSYYVYLVDEFEDDDILGLCEPETKQILIRFNLGKREMMATFIHEVLHAIEFEHGIAIPHALISQIDTSIEQVLRLNKWI